MAQAPTASMSSVNRGGSSSGGGASFGGGSVRGASRASLPAQTTIHTAASSVRGGVTASQTYAAMRSEAGPGHGHGRAKTSGAPDVPVYSECGCVDKDGDGKCDMCGYDMPEDEFDECGCMAECGYCWCPIGDGWSVWLFMTIIAAAYAHYSVRARKQNTICES